ncbi:MAG: hypothetical protein IJW27_06655, partial [Clostridia bacterium]|nr:hypothetical protein [Clostridia bacterium]
VNYEYAMEVGKEYDVTFWIKLAAEAEGTIDFIHADHPQVNSPTTAGYQPIVDLSTAKTGEWVQYKVVITANSPYLLVRLPKGTEAYLDTFQIVPTGNEGEIGKDMVGFNPGAVQTEPGKDGGNATLVIILSIVGGVILLAAIATVVVIFVKKGKKTKA